MLKYPFKHSQQARRNEIDIGGGGLKRGESEASKNGDRGLAPGKIFHDHAL